MKALEFNQLVFVSAAMMVVLVEASRRHVVHGDRSWSSTWTWPTDGASSFPNDFIQDTDYNQIADYDASGNQNQQQYLTGFGDNTASLPDEALIDLLYARTGRSRTISADHPTLLERTTYTALNDPEIDDDNTQYLSRRHQQRQQQQQQQIQPHQQNYPIISGYAHTIIH